MKDEGKPFGFGGQKPEPNHPMRLLLRAMVVGDLGKSCKNSQVRMTEMNASEPLMQCRNVELRCQNQAQPLGFAQVQKGQNVDTSD